MELQVVVHVDGSGGLKSKIQGCDMSNIDLCLYVNEPARCDIYIHVIPNIVGPYWHHLW